MKIKVIRAIRKDGSWEDMKLEGFDSDNPYPWLVEDGLEYKFSVLDLTNAVALYLETGPAVKGKAQKQKTSCGCNLTHAEFMAGISTRSR